MVDRLFEQLKIQPQIAYEIEEDGSMAGLVAGNFGIAVMPEIPVLKTLNVETLKIRNQHERRYVYMAKNREQYQPPLVRRFEEYVKRRRL